MQVIKMFGKSWICKERQQFLLFKHLVDNAAHSWSQCRHQIVVVLPFPDWNWPPSKIKKIGKCFHTFIRLQRFQTIKWRQRQLWRWLL